MLNYIPILIGILLSSLSSYFSVKVLVKYIYLYAESFYRKPLLFILLYTGLISSLTMYIASINLTISNNALLGYYLLLYNATLDLAIVLGILTFFRKIEKIEVSKNFVFASSLAFTVHLFLILKKKLNLIDALISFMLFIIISAMLIREEKEKGFVKREKLTIKDFLLFLPIFIISVAIIYASSHLISFFLIYLNNLLNNTPLSAYITNIINTVTQSLIFTIAIMENREKAEEGLLPILGEIIFTFTIYVGTVSGITPVIFSGKSLLPAVSPIFLMYISLILLNLLARGVALTRESGIILILLSFILGLLTMV